jgi:hypothetical protein
MPWDADGLLLKGNPVPLARRLAVGFVPDLFRLEQLPHSDLHILTAELDVLHFFLPCEQGPPHLGCPVPRLRGGAGELF